MSTLYAEDALERMRRDLVRANKRDKKTVHWGMAIDLAKCIGCHACAVACVSENTLPPGVVYRPVMEREVGAYPNVRRSFLPRPCMQCENPPCVSVCPVKATWKNEQGVTVVAYERCIGCRYCLVACPYGARTSDFAEYWTDKAPMSPGLVGKAVCKEGLESTPQAEYGKAWPKRGGGSPIGNARKCHFCLHRLAVNRLPSCVTSCVGRATYFGDLNDPESLLAEVIASPRAFKLKEELGTKPSVVYLA